MHTAVFASGSMVRYVFCMSEIEPRRAQSPTYREENLSLAYINLFFKLLRQAPRRVAQLLLGLGVERLALLKLRRLLLALLRQTQLAQIQQARGGGPQLLSRAGKITRLGLRKRTRLQLKGGHFLDQVH